MAQPTIPATYGALLLGGLFAAVLSGLIAVQVVIYLKMYPEDSRRTRLIVLSVWTLDVCHTVCIWAALWDYIVDRFGEANGIDFIPWTMAAMVFTAILTFLVHCFFAHRIFRLSKQNWALTIPIVILALLRLVSAAATTAEMIHTHSFSTFRLHFRWLFTLGLALSSAIDVIITGSLFFLLQKSRPDGARLNRVIDMLILYAFETGSLTCAGTIAAMLCWLASQNNLIFMGLHFVIGKLYANSLLVTLNTRQKLRLTNSKSGEFLPPILHLDPRRSSSQKRPESSKGGKLEINVERSIQYDMD
ncbi:hypothetical protein BD779DRAFT_1672431 [Infundibulicybe gibba]|nr:hypothetical protein BD779DRAFT_1672431 [Infundibulicybe gibba]